MPPTQPQSPFKWGRLSKTLSFWLLVILVPVAILQLSNSRAEPTVEMDYSAYREQLDSNNIARVTIQDGSVVQGSFKQPVQVRDRTVRAFTTRLPVKDSEGEIALLQTRGVHIKAQGARPSFGTFLLNYLPLLLLLGFWIFLFRQMQAGGAKAFSFGKSKAKLLTGDTPKVTFFRSDDAIFARLRPKERTPPGPPWLRRGRKKK